MPLVADQEDRVTLGRVAPRLGVDLRYERAGRVHGPQVPACRALVHRRRHSVRGEHEHGTLGGVILALDEDRSATFEVADDVRVVHDLLPDVDGRAPELEGPLHGFHGSFDPRAIPAGGSKKQPPDHGN